MSTTLAQYRAAVSSKRCWTCKIVLPASEFYRSKKYKDGLQGRCKECSRRSLKEWEARNPNGRREISIRHYYKNRERYKTEARRYRHGISDEEFQQLLKKQGGLCAICRAPQHEPGRSLHVDHCHDSGDIRGLLCGNCNRVLGLMKNEPTRLRAAAEYLEG